MRLKPGQRARPFQTTDIFDNAINLADFAEQNLLLSFYRYASCPLCNFRVLELIKRYADFSSRGLKMLAIFQSPVESVSRYVGRQDASFPIIADPRRKIYRLYGVESSWWGFLRAAWWWHPTMIKANRKGFWPGKMEGDKALIPADFLITPQQTIHTAFYGSTIADHLPIADIEAFLDEAPADESSAK